MFDFEKYGIIPVGPVPNERQLAHYRMGKKAFFHFGVNTFTDLEWGNGTELEKIFNPSSLDIRQWIRSIKESGFELAIITAKHHDGFCLWPSKFTEHSIKNSPYKSGKGDLIREFTDACREYGIKAGVYISPWDRNSPWWGSEDYSFYFADQLRELLTEYGKIDEVWWDGAGSLEAVYHWDLWANIVRECQPTACIFGSMGATPFVDLRWVGNEKGYAGETHYATIHARSLMEEGRTALNEGDIFGDRYIPSETDVSIRPGWFYHADQDEQVKTASHISKIWFESVGRNSMMLLNFPPDRRGLLPEKDVKNALMSHRCIEKMLSKNFIRDSVITADHTLCGELSAQNLALSDDDFIWAAEKEQAVIDIYLDGKNKINVLALKEVIEVGERVMSYQLESIEENETKMLYHGTSIGFYRAIQIPSQYYTHLRLTILAAKAPPVLREISLHFFEEEQEEKTVREIQDLAHSSLSEIQYTDDGKAAVISFGGIYPFNTVSFHPKQHTNYRILAFNGQSYEKIAEGKCDAVWDKIQMPFVIDSSYKIKIETESGFFEEDPIEVYLSKNM